MQVDFEVFDIVLTDNGWIYSSAVLWTSMDEDIHVIEIATNARNAQYVENTAVYKLHPDGQRLYGARLNLSPTYLLMVDISEGAVNDYYDFRYHGDYEVYQNLWLSENGERIFTGCGYIFRASSTPSRESAYNGGEMLYETTLNREGICVPFAQCTSVSLFRSICDIEMSRLGFIQHLTHSTAAKRLLLIASPKACMLDTEFLTPRKKIIYFLIINVLLKRGTKLLS